MPNNSNPLTPEIQNANRYATPTPGAVSGSASSALVAQQQQQQQQQQAQPNQPQFHYEHIDVSNDDLYQVFEGFLKVRENLPILQLLGSSTNVKVEMIKVAGQRTTPAS